MAVGVLEFVYEDRAELAPERGQHPGVSEEGRRAFFQIHEIQRAKSLLATPILLDARAGQPRQRGERLVRVFLKRSVPLKGQAGISNQPLRDGDHHNVRVVSCLLVPRLLGAQFPDTDLPRLRQQRQP